MTDLVGGQLNYMFSPLQNALPYIQQGKIRAIAVAMPKRSPKLPNIPTINELGYKDVDLSNWFAVYAPANTPPAVIQKLNAAFVKVGNSPEMRSKFEQLGFDSFFTTPDGGQDFMRSELVRWARVAAYAGIKPE
jgi:tripartite-type tricarboxylate transporter receptor subunit TctC